MIILPEYNREDMQKQIWILSLLLCVVMILTAGCTSSISSAPSVTTTPQPEDPIIGSWMTIGDSTLYYIFLPDGKFQSGELRSPGLMSLGNWSKTGENKYLVKIKGASDEDFVYVPSGDYIYWAIAPGAHATRYDKTI